MTVMSGKLATAAVGATPVSTLRNWRTSQTLESKTFVTSNTHLGTGRRPGVIDWNGNVGQYGVIPQIMPGDKGTFNGYIGPTTGVPGSNGFILSGNFICDNIQVVLNWSSAELVQMVASLQGNGPLTKASGPAVPDTTPPATFPSGEGKVEFALSTAPTVFTPFCCNQATFNLLVAMHPYSNSCGYDATAKAMARFREAGPIDWNLAIVSDDVSLFESVNYKVGTYVVVKLWVSLTQFWLLKYGIIDSYSDFTCDRETGALETYTMNVLMNVDKADGTVTDGSITIPGGAQPWWPITGALALEGGE